MATRGRIRILLVDDQPLFVQSLAQVIEFRAPDIEVTGIAEDGGEAIALAAETNPDIILMDIQMPRTTGVEATRVIMDQSPETKIMMLTTFDEDEYIIESLHYGARGYLLKNLPPEEVITAIRALYSGIDQISPQVVKRITGYVLAGERPGAGSASGGELPQWFIALTNLEKTLLKDLAKGLANKEIASLRNLAEQTVKNYLSTVYEKMNVRTRSQAVRRYMDCGIDKYVD